MHGDPVWIDLSTFDVGATQGFYRSLFGWHFEPEDSGYATGFLAETPCVGLYEMPEPFQKMGMPSFWMTYFSVTDLAATVAKAKELGGKVEIEEHDTRGKIALIRDPAGAGFTCYEGHELAAPRDFRTAGLWCWSELFVSDLSRVESFYTTLFGWTIEAQTHGRSSIRNSSGRRIGAIQEASAEIKGDKEYWAVFFAVQNLDEAANQVEGAGGSRGPRFENSDGRHAVAYDPQGASFFLTEIDGGPGEPPPTGGTPLKWRSLVGLISVYLIVLLEQEWAWGLLFLFWVLPDLKSGVTYFIEPLSRKDNPVLYWSVVLTWLWLAAYTLAWYLYPSG